MGGCGLYFLSLPLSSSSSPSSTLCGPSPLLLPLLCLHPFSSLPHATFVAHVPKPLLSLTGHTGKAHTQQHHTHTHTHTHRPPSRPSAAQTSGPLSHQSHQPCCPLHCCGHFAGSGDLGRHCPRVLGAHAWVRELGPRRVPGSRPQGLSLGCRASHLASSLPALSELPQRSTQQYSTGRRFDAALRAARRPGRRTASCLLTLLGSQGRGVVSPVALKSCSQGPCGWMLPGRWQALALLSICWIPLGLLSPQNMTQNMTWVWGGLERSFCPAPALCLFLILVKLLASSSCFSLPSRLPSPQLASSLPA